MLLRLLGWLFLWIITISNSIRIWIMWLCEVNFRIWIWCLLCLLSWLEIVVRVIRKLSKMRVYVWWLLRIITIASLVWRSEIAVNIVWIRIELALIWIEPLVWIKTLIRIISWILVRIYLIWTLIRVNISLIWTISLSSESLLSVSSPIFW